MRRFLVALTVVTTGLAAGLVPTAAAQAERAPAETTRVVHDAADYRDAIADLSTDDTGPHRIVFAADIDLGATPATWYEGVQPLTIEGNGHTLRSTADHTLIVGPAGTTLTIDSLTLRGAGAGISWQGAVVVRDSRFTRLGRGHPLEGIGSIISVGRGGSLPPVLLITDTVFEDNRSRISAITSSGKITGTRVTIRGNDAEQAIVRALGRVRLTSSSVVGNLARYGPAISSHSGDIELTGTDVARNSHRLPGSTGNPTIQSSQTVRLVRSTIHGNPPIGSGRGRVAVDTVDLVAQSSIIRHAARACWIRGTTTATNSIASDRSCGF